VTNPVLGSGARKRRFPAVTPVAAMVVTYMNSIGMAAKAGLRPVSTSQMVASSRLSAASSWFEARNSCHR